MTLPRLRGKPVRWKRADRPEPQQWFEGVRMPAGCREHHPALVTTRIVYREVVVDRVVEQRVTAGYRVTPFGFMEIASETPDMRPWYKRLGVLA